MILDVAERKLWIVTDFTCVSLNLALSMPCLCAASINHTIHVRSGRKWVGTEAKTNLKILNKVRTAYRTRDRRLYILEFTGLNGFMGHTTDTEPQFDVSWMLYFCTSRLGAKAQHLTTHDLVIINTSTFLSQTSEWQHYSLITYLFLCTLGTSHAYLKISFNII